MAEPILREPALPVSAASGERETTRVIRGATQDLFERLQTRWEELKERIANPTTTPSLIRELRDDVDYIRARARYFHENRPLQAVGVVAGAAFVLGLMVGLVRRR